MNRFFTQIISSFFFFSATIFGFYTTVSASPVLDSTRLQAENLIRQAAEMSVSSPVTALEKAHKAYRLLKPANKKDSLLSEAAYQLGYGYFMTGEIDSSVVWLNRILAWPETAGTTKAKALNVLSIDYRKLGDNAKASLMAQKALAAYRSVNDSSGMMAALINDAKVYQRQGNNKKAMYLYRQALQYSEKMKDTLNTGILNSLIGNVYMDIEQIDKGKAYYRKAINVLKHSDNNYYGDILNNYGIVFYDEGKYDSALYYYQQALDVYQKINQLDAIGAGFQNIGITYVMMHNEKRGLEYLHRALDIFNKQDLTNDQASAMVDLGQAYMETGQYDSAVDYLKRALDISEKINSTYYKKQALLMLYRLNEKRGNSEEALKYYKLYSEFKDSLDNQALKENLQELEVKYQTAKQEKEIQFLRDREVIAKARKRLLVMGITTVVILSVLIIAFLVYKRKKDAVVQRQKLLVYKKEKALAEAELKKKHAEEKQLQNELEFKTKQLATHALNMMQKNKLLQEISDEIDARIKSTDFKEKDTMRLLKRKLVQGLHMDRDWDVFKLYFEQVNKDFFTNLRNINPNLTSNDFKLAALIRLNMNIKEMASVLNISPASLKNARYRLKKKLKLTDKDSLVKMIRNL